MSFFTSSDFIKELKKDAQLCKISKDGKPLTKYSNESEFNDLLIRNVKAYINKLATSTDLDLQTYLTQGIKKAYTWYNSLFWGYIVLVIIYVVFTFSLTLDIEANDNKTSQIPDWAKIFYIIYGTSVLWIGLVVFILLWWLVSPRVCDSTWVRVAYLFIGFTIIYVFITQLTLDGPLIREEQFSDDDSFKYNLTTVGTWILFAVIVITIAFYIYKVVAKGKQSKNVETEQSTSSTMQQS